MGNLHSTTEGRQASRALARGMGDLPPLPGAVPDHAAPTMARWGLSSAACAPQRRKSDAGVGHRRLGRFTSLPGHEVLPGGTRPPPGTDRGMSAPAEEVLALRRPLPDRALAAP
jgi:hypothetical protein